ncbi:MAG: hypothetical protein AB7U97_26730 [Pirellulales bacterium]
MTNTGVRKHRGESEWRRLIAEQERSGLSQREFCERAGLCAQSLTNWRRRIGAASSPPASRGSAVSVRHDGPSAAFVEIGTTLSRPLDAGVRVRLELGAGVVLELSRV